MFYSSAWTCVTSMKRKVALFLSVIMILGMTLQVSATESNSNIGELSECTIGISCKSNGVGITVSTSATAKADEIGCKDIVLEEKVGNTWVAINIPGGYETNSYDYDGGAVYTGAVKGRTYRAHCTHYARWGSTTKEQSNSIGEMVYN